MQNSYLPLHCRILRAAVMLSCIGFSVAVAQPSVFSFTPLSGAVGTVVTITGKSFSPLPTGNTVYFGAMCAQITTATDSTLTAVVPLGTTYAPISVTTNYLTAWSSLPFNITFPGTGLLDSLSFKNKTDITNAGCSNISTGDLDTDGKPDVVATSYTAPYYVSVYRNTSAGTMLSFDIAVNIDSNVGGQPIIKDIDGDGKLDIVTADNGDILVYRNTSEPGHIQFEAAKIFYAGVDNNNIAIGDINSDGKPDIIGTEESDGYYVILVNVSAPSGVNFVKQTPVDIVPGLHTPCLADVNNDGKIDLILQVNGSNVDGDDGVGVYINKTDTTGIRLDEYWGTTAVKHASGIASGDLNGDGFNDFALASTSANIQVAKNYGTGTFIANTYLPLRENLNGYVAIGDVNGDSIPDIIASEFRSIDSSMVAVFQNRSDNTLLTFDNKISYFGGSRVYGQIIEDFDGDGRPDIAFADPNADVFTILRNAATILPVKLFSFSGTALGKINRLNWQTATEKNTSAFIIERATANLQFMPIGKIPATQTSNTIQEYTFTDGAPLSDNYYRLKIIDADGRFNYSNTIKIAGGIAMRNFAVFPNPAVNYITVQHPAASKAIITLTGMDGKTITVLQPAANAVQSTLNVNGLAKGIYQIIWSNGSNHYSQSVMVK